MVSMPGKILSTFQTQSYSKQSGQHQAKPSQRTCTILFWIDSSGIWGRSNWTWHKMNAKYVVIPQLMQSITVTFTIKTVRNNKYIPIFFFLLLAAILLGSGTVCAPFLLILHKNNETMLFYLDTTTSACMYAIIAVRQRIFSTT